jgi:hypothetical protein
MAARIDSLISHNTLNNASAFPGLKPDEILSRRTQFLNVLSEWHSTPALAHLWVVVFNIPSLLTDANMNLWGEKLAQDDWGVDNTINELHDAQKGSSIITGCMFAQSVELPGEFLKTKYVGTFNRGFTTSPVMVNRNEPYYFNIKLFESNSSFTDTIIRPWVILAAHFGLVARDHGDTIKSNLTIFELAKSGDYTQDLIPRKTWHFYNCVPVRVMPQTMGYSTDQHIITRNTQWIYTRYQMVQAN